MQKALALMLLAMAPMATPSPTEVVQSGIEQVVQVVQDYDAGHPDGAEKRRSEIRRVAGRLFDFPEMARRTLARHWSERTPGEREEFVSLFRDLLERSYIAKLENYTGERIIYLGETVDGEYATVRSKIMGRGTEMALAYRLHLVNSRWAVYDVLIEGVSFVGNYRSQFNRIISKGSYEDLVRKLKTGGLEGATLDRLERAAAVR
ncbi:MAG TPA: ABC transporter substrate-binding protein [Verrucomicrobiae bacterium]|jgi:phospholipid transport system substrate-binding protein|nr:ABC transporter substrate-binding protein [Verrucomicrobiae bacterium]